MLHHFSLIYASFNLFCFSARHLNWIKLQQFCNQCKNGCAKSIDCSFSISKQHFITITQRDQQKWQSKAGKCDFTFARLEHLNDFMLFNQCFGACLSDTHTELWNCFPFILVLLLLLFSSLSLSFFLVYLKVVREKQISYDFSTKMHEFWYRKDR